MAITITLPVVLAKLAKGERAHSASGATLGEAVADLAQRYPELAPRLRDERGEPYPYVTYYVNDEDARFHGGFGARVRDGDEVIVVPAIAGG
ncbi:MAG TPA: MoaD/ThiS family protein [Gemmatimonadaceae bacterium]|nr:MoaD/ThiS family protein [Gemmatimonadaceae bacterium]